MSAWLPMLLQEPAAAEPEMTAAAWVFMGLAWLGVIALTWWCFRRVLGGGRRQP